MADFLEAAWWNFLCGGFACLVAGARRMLTRALDRQDYGSAFFAAVAGLSGLALLGASALSFVALAARVLKAALA